VQSVVIYSCSRKESRTQIMWLYWSHRNKFFATPSIGIQQLLSS